MGKSPKTSGIGKARLFGREVRSLNFKCRDCNGTEGEVLPYEDIFVPKAKPQPVQVQIDTGENGTIGAMIDHGYTFWAFCHG
jgi:hypothetical protein